MRDDRIVPNFCRPLAGLVPLPTQKPTLETVGYSRSSSGLWGPVTISNSVRSEIFVEPLPRKSQAPYGAAYSAPNGAWKYSIVVSTNISPLIGSGNLRLRTFASLRSIRNLPGSGGLGFLLHHDVDRVTKVKSGCRNGFAVDNV